MNTDVRGGEALGGNTGRGGGRRGGRWRLAVWAAAALVLLLPLLAMQFTDEMKWGVADFVFAGALLFGAALTYELVTRTRASLAYRAAVGVAVAAALVLVWVNLAVGIIGSEDNPANLMYFGVLAIGIIGAVVARFRPHGMARALVATALAQMLVTVVALFAGLGSAGPVWPQGILMLIGSGFFAALWLISAGLFRKAARGGAERGAV